ncbi:MAG: type IV pilin-like G/H family protein [Hormoscilla sp. GM7CHS1pb]|nr:type IV pilin-like G/H family protein [Hormoscilla sp. GM7CHS1pb]
MKTEFKTKFLQHLIDKKQDKGFTLIELLVVIIIIGILSAIALPSFLNQANKARESEAKNYVGSMNRAQQAHYQEKSKFTTEVSDLGLNIQTKTENYTYGIIGGGASTGITNWGTSAGNANLKSYVGVVNVSSTSADTTTFSALCESDNNNQAKPTETYNTAAPTCPSNYSQL